MNDREQSLKNRGIGIYNTSYRRKDDTGLYKGKKTTFKIKKRRVFAGALIAINLMLVLSYHNARKELADAKTPTIPTVHILTETVEVADYGDTIYDIASEYYNNAYTGIYPTLNDYATVIQEQNGIQNPTRLEQGDSLRIPVITSNQNDHFIRALQIQQEIDEIKKSEYWVEYTIQFGDTISDLAAKASGDFRETPLLTKKIIAKNNLSGILREGITIYIINPKLGPLKIELQKVQDQFQQSLKETEEITKTK